MTMGKTSYNARHDPLIICSPFLNSEVFSEGMIKYSKTVKKTDGFKTKVKYLTKLTT